MRKQANWVFLNMRSRMHDSLALIASWWWMCASYGVWCVLALVNEYWILMPDIVIAWSWSAWTMSYYVAQQYESIRNIRINLLSTKKFINPRRVHKIIDIDYLIDDIFKKQDPLDVHAIYQSSITYAISMTDVETGIVEYLSNKDSIDIFEIMRATKAMPFFYWKKVCLKKRWYFDSPNSSAIWWKIEYARQLWAKKIIVIDSGIKTPWRAKKIFLWWKSKQFKENYMAESYHINHIPVSSESTIITLRPNKPLSLWVLQNDKQRILAAIQQWYEETVNNHALQDFCKRLLIEW